MDILEGDNPPVNRHGALPISSHHRNGMVVELIDILVTALIDLNDNQGNDHVWD